MPKSIRLPVGDLLDRLRDEFAYHAQAKGLVLRVVAVQPPRSAAIRDCSSRCSATCCPTP